MRISTSMIFSSGATNLSNLQSRLYDLQNQLSTGKRLTQPADDPIASAQVVVVSQQKAVNQRFLANQQGAEDQLAELESRLSGVGDLLFSVRTRVVEAGNGAYTDNDRKAIASEVRERFDELLGLANSADAMGNYVFSGLRGGTKPFSVSGAVGSRSITYNGDDGRRQLQVGSSRYMDVSEAGSDLFARIPQGNGQFTFAPSAGNTGTGLVSTGTVISGYAGATYKISFTSPTTFDVTDGAGAPLVPPMLAQSYVSGNQIVLGSGANQISVDISGSPAAGDVFNVAPAANQDMFTTLDQFIAALETPVQGSAQRKTALANALSSITLNLDQAMERVSLHETAIGTRRTELEALSTTASALDVQYQSDLSNLSNLQYVDYAQAITALTQQKMMLDAAQASFSKVSQMSLFSYL